MFCEYAKTGRGRTRTSAHDTVESKRTGVPPREFAARAPFPDDTCLSFYERQQGSGKNDAVDLPALADLKIGVVPVINPEWIQKIHCDRDGRGYSTEAVTDVILCRMHADVHCICPQFTPTDINFQRVRMVDTSNPSSRAGFPHRTKA